MKRRLAASLVGATVLGGSLAAWLLAPRAGTPEPPAAPPQPASARASAAPVTNLPDRNRPVEALDYQSASRKVEQEAAAAPKEYRARMQAGEFYIRAGDYARAIPHLEAACRLSPDELMPWVMLGDAGILSGNLRVAERSYDCAAKLEPENPLVIRGRGEVLAQLGRFAEARKVLEEGVKRHPGNAHVRMVLGNLHLQMGSAGAAVEVLEPAVEKVPDRTDARMLLASAYQQDRRLEKAAQEYREVTRRAPQADEAWGRLGLLQVKLGQYAEARDALTQAVRLNPGQSHYLWALGDAYAQDTSAPENLARAIGMYRRALDLEPQNAEALRSLSLVLARRGTQEDLKEAAGVLKRLIPLRADDPNPRYQLARVYGRLGNRAEAARRRKEFDALFQRRLERDRQSAKARSFHDTAEAHVTRGQRLLEQRQWGSAAAEFRLALDRDPGLAPAQAGLRVAEARAAEAKEREE